MGNKKKYIKPQVELVVLDYSITLMQMSVSPTNPPIDERQGSSRPSNSDPFASPFNSKPFS